MSARITTAMPVGAQELLDRPNCHVTDRWLLAIKTVADMFSVSEDTVRRLIESGRLRAINLSPSPGKSRAVWRVRVEDVRAFLDNHGG